MKIIEEMQATRYEILEKIREELGESEETEMLVDYIQDLWETVDLLKRKFSQERTLEIMHAPAPFIWLAEEI